MASGDERHDAADQSAKRSGNGWILGISLGIALGVSFGVATHEVGTGIGFGVAIGIVFAVAFGAFDQKGRNRRPDPGPVEDRPEPDGGSG